MTPTPVLYTHCRREARRTMEVPASLAFVDSDGRTLAGGKAVLVDFSTGGAKFARVELIGRTLPVGKIRIEFELVGEDHEGIRGSGRPVRWEWGAEPAVGIELESFSVEVGRNG